MKRYSTGWRAYWVIVRYRNTPVWVAERGGIRFVDRMLHVSVQDQRELARRWANGNCDTMFDGPGLTITDWLQTRLALFNSMSHPDEWYETEEEAVDHRYHPWEIDSTSSAGCSTSDGYSLERSSASQSEEDWAPDWDEESLPASLVEPSGRFYRVRIEYDSDEDSYDDNLDAKLFEARGHELYDDSGSYEVASDSFNAATPEGLTERYVPCSLGLRQIGKVARFVTSNQIEKNLVSENTTSIVKSWCLKRTLVGVAAFYLLSAATFVAIIYSLLPAGMATCCLARPIIEVETWTGLRGRYSGLYGYWFGNPEAQVEDYVCMLDTGVDSIMCNEAHKLARTFHFMGMNTTRQEFAARYVMGNGTQCRCEPMQAALETIDAAKAKVFSAIEEFGLFSTIGMALSSFFGMLKSFCHLVGVSTC